MTFEELTLSITGNHAMLYVVTLTDKSPMTGLIDGPYRGYASHPVGRTADYIYVTQILRGASNTTAVRCEDIASIEVHQPNLLL